MLFLTLRIITLIAINTTACSYVHLKVVMCKSVYMIFKKEVNNQVRVCIYKNKITSNTNSKNTL